MNSITRPAAGTTTGKVWEIADSLSGTAFVSRQTIIEACVAAGVNPATAATQYAKWVKARTTPGEYERTPEHVVHIDLPEPSGKLRKVEAIHIIEGRGYEVQYLTNDMYRVQPERGGQWPSYYHGNDLIALAELTKAEMRDCIRGDQRPNPYMVVAETSEDDEQSAAPFTSDEILIQTEDYLRANEGLGVGRGLSPERFLTESGGNIARYNLGRYVAAITASANRRGAVKDDSGAYYPSH